MIDLTNLDTVAKAYAAHNRLHAEYVDARWGKRRKVTMQEDHEGIVRKLLELGGKHLPKGEALDDTLPQDLREAFKARYLSDNIVLAEGDPVTSIIQVLRTGTFYHPQYGKFTIAVADLENMIANFTNKRPKAPTEMVVDFEHMSIAEPPQVAPAAGWVKGLSLEDEALFAAVEWTEDAADKIRKKEYRFISPEFSLNYRDKETGKSIGATLVAVALTNRPFLEGMLPVVLSEELASAFALSELTLQGINTLIAAEGDEGYTEKADLVRRAYRAFTGERDFEWVVEVYDEAVVVEKADGLYNIPYTLIADSYVFDIVNQQKVKRVYVAASDSTPVEWTAAYIDGLPDDCFAYIKSGGKQGEDGKTEPRSLRFLPYKDEDGAFDLSRWRKAMTRLPDTQLTAEEQTKAKAALNEAAKEAGVDEAGEEQNNDKGASKMSDAIRKLLGLANGAEDAAVEGAIQALQAKATGADEINTKLTTETKRADDAELTLLGQEADTLVAKALEDKKILPKQQEWAKNYCLTDRAGFDAYIENAAPVGPETGEKGSEHAAKGEAITASERKAAKKLGVTEEQLVALKEKDAAAEAEAEE